MHVVFANTGVQLVCQRVDARLKMPAGQAERLGWQRCECRELDGSTKPYHFVQWQIRNGNQLFFAVDTTCGNSDKGFFCSPEALAGDMHVALTQLLDAQHQPIPNFPRVDIVIRPATAAGGDPIPVQMVIDFGNSRTGALLIETGSDPGVIPLMSPFELINRYQLDAWNEHGELQRNPSARWFNSRTHWCQSPYLPPPTLEIQVFDQAEGIPISSGFFKSFRGSRPPAPKTAFVTPRLFQDLSAVRMGHEVDDITQAMRTDADMRSGVSSPKRYLWARDSRWLGGGIWHMADPWQRCGSAGRSAVLQGPFFRFLAENDPDELNLPSESTDEISDEEIARETPLQPRHAPCSMMVAAIYELVCQAYTYLNSIEYRRLLGDQGRPRELRNLALTFPSGMIPQERDRFRQQAQKAVDIFFATLGRAQRMKPNVAMSIDEASAVHLAYIWSELQILERNAKLWFSLMGRPHPAATGAPAALAATPKSRPGGGTTRPGGQATAPPSGEVRIGCIDIGGGTSDLMIARYTHQAGFVELIEGEMLHRDGISLAGDHLIKRLLERLIVPHLADHIGLGRDEVQRLFGQEVPANHRFRSERIKWMNRLFVPLAQGYLQAAVEEDTDKFISHTDPDFVPDEVVTSLQEIVDQEFGRGNFIIKQDLALKYDPAFFDELVFEVFNELLVDFCGRLVKYDVDVVLLAGQPTKLRQIQELVKQYLPLQSSRVVPLHNHYAGNWYPYQDPQGRDPGVIVDPKSAVVVGAAVEFLMSRGRLGNTQFHMKDLVDQDQKHDNDYYWGIMTEGTSRIQDSKLLFRPPQPGEQPVAVERRTFQVVAERVLIGRRLSANEDAEATTVWALRVEKGDRDGKIDLTVTLERHRRTVGTAGKPETMVLTEAKGTVAGDPALVGEDPDCNVNFFWRTLADDAYYLDTGALDSIET